MRASDSGALASSADTSCLMRARMAVEDAAPPAADFRDQLLADITDARLTADELLRRYCTLVFATTGSYEATARKLKLDRRTVRAKIDAAAIEKLKSTSDR